MAEVPMVVCIAPRVYIRQPVSIYTFSIWIPECLFGYHLLFSPAREKQEKRKRSSIALRTEVENGRLKRCVMPKWRHTTARMAYASSLAVTSGQVPMIHCIISKGGWWRNFDPILSRWTRLMRSWTAGTRYLKAIFQNT